MNGFRGIRLAWVAGIAIALLAAPLLPASALAVGMAAPTTQAACCPDEGAGQHFFSVHDQCCVSCSAAGFALPLTAMTTPFAAPSADFIPSTGITLAHQALGPPPTPPPKV